MQCPNPECGKTITSEDALFCNHCGCDIKKYLETTQAATDSQPGQEKKSVFCWRCGQEGIYGTKHCTNCGAELKYPPKERQRRPCDITDVTPATNTSAAGVVVSLLAAVASLMFAFGPMLHLDVYFVARDISYADLLVNLGQYSEYLGAGADLVSSADAGLSILILLILVLPAIAIPCGIAAAVKSFRGGGRELIWFVPCFAILLAVLIQYASGQSYGVISASGWLWVCALVGLAAALLHVVVYGKKDTPPVAPQLQ